MSYGVIYGVIVPTPSRIEGAAAGWRGYGAI